MTMAKTINRGQAVRAHRTPRGASKAEAAAGGRPNRAEQAKTEARANQAAAPDGDDADRDDRDEDLAEDQTAVRLRTNGPRGSAPWATRHAAKRAAEAAARNATPPPPGSARATLRTPERAEELKIQLTELANGIAKLRQLKRSIQKDFWEAASILADIHDRQLYLAKGYASFEAFVDREVELGKATSIRLARLPKLFIPTAAKELGLTSLLAALEAIDGDRESQTRIAIAQPAKPLKPPMAARG
jgi:hypothetical protein